MAHEEKLQEAITLIRSGGKHLAVPILRDLIQADRNNETAWLWLSTCMATSEDKRYCLNQVLRINPNNTTAKKALAQLKLTPALDDMQPPTPANDPPAFTPARKRHQGSGIGVLTAILIILVIVGGLAAYYLEYGPCGTRSVEDAVRQIEPLASRWDVAYNQTANSSSAMLAGNIQQLQTIRIDMNTVKVTYCMETAKGEIVSGMDDFTNSFLVGVNIFNTNASRDSAALVQQGNTHFKKFKTEMERIHHCAPLCELNTQ